MTQEMAQLVHDIGIAVKYAGQYFAFAYTAFYYSSVSAVGKVSPAFMNTR